VAQKSLYVETASLYNT